FAIEKVGILYVVGLEIDVLAIGQPDIAILVDLELAAGVPDGSVDLGEAAIGRVAAIRIVRLDDSDRLLIIIVVLVDGRVEGDGGLLRRLVPVRDDDRDVLDDAYRRGAGRGNVGGRHADDIEMLSRLRIDLGR